MSMARPRRTSNASGSSSTDGISSSFGGGNEPSQELSSMYDYLAKIILLGPSGAGKSCVLHRFLRNEWRALSSQTIGVEFGSKIVALGTGARRTRIKLQLWDTAGTERFRAVSRSYYRGAAGALLIYDVASYASFGALPTFLRDARALASPKLGVVLVGNKVDVDMPESVGVDDAGLVVDSSRPSTRGGTAAAAASLNNKTSAGSFTQADSDIWASEAGGRTAAAAGEYDDDDDNGWDRRTERGIDISSSSSRSIRTTASASSATTTTSSGSASGIPLTPSSTSSAGSMGSTSTVRHGYGQHAATRAPHGREVDGPTAARWASSQAIPVNMEVSALSGTGVDDAFRRLAQIILTKIELGEIDPDDPQSGIQYGDAGWWGGGGGGSGGAPDSFDGFDDGGSSIRSGGGTLRRRKGKGGKGRVSGGPGGGSSGLREWEAVFRLDRRSSRKRGCC